MRIAFPAKSLREVTYRFLEKEKFIPSLNTLYWVHCSHLRIPRCEQFREKLDSEQSLHTPNDNDPPPQAVKDES